MKKILIAFAILFSIVIPINANAVDQKSLVIIDSYFDSRATGATIVCAPTLNCSKVLKPTTFFDNTNHGDAMVEVAKKQGVKNIIALMSASNGSDVNPGYFIEALKWINTNSNSVAAVSFSRKLNSDTSCMPAASFAGNPVNEDKIIRDLISTLNAKGIKIFASTGNNGKTGPVDYPACILDTASVTANNYTQATSDANTDYIGSLPNNIFVYNGTIVWSTNTLISQTTSSATVAVAAQYVKNNTLTSKIINVLP